MLHRHSFCATGTSLFTITSLRNTGSDSIPSLANTSSVLNTKHLNSTVFLMISFDLQQLHSSSGFRSAWNRSMIEVLLPHSPSHQAIGTRSLLSHRNISDSPSSLAETNPSNLENNYLNASIHTFNPTMVGSAKKTSNSDLRSIVFCVDSKEMIKYERLKDLTNYLND